MDAIYHKLLPPISDYIQLQQIEARKNSNRFWKATTAFLKGDVVEFRNILSKMAEDNQDFDLNTFNRGHIYVHKVFEYPYEIVVGEAKPHDTEPNIEISNPSTLIQRFYNPAQLALSACSLAGKIGPEFSDSFVDVVKKTYPNDYYVVVSESTNKYALEKLESAVFNSIQDNREEAEAYGNRINENAIPGFARMMTDGASECNIPEPAFRKIYRPFSFDPQILSSETRSQLVFGGRLNSKQASTLAQFLKNVIADAPEIRQAQKKLALAFKVYVARMQLDQ